MKRFLFTLTVFNEDGKPNATIYRAVEANTKEEAREKICKQCAEKKRVCRIKRVYVEI